jgi:hypothetical protein
MCDAELKSMMEHSHHQEAPPALAAMAAEMAVSSVLEGGVQVCLGVI